MNRKSDPIRSRKGAFFVFDIDGTICEKNGEVPYPIAEILKQLYTCNTIAFATGKPFSFVAGMCNQLGLQDSLVIAENGLVLAGGTKFPPAFNIKEYIPAKIKFAMRHIKLLLVKKYGDLIWFQPNELALTIFPRNPELLYGIFLVAKEHCPETLSILLNEDSVDIIPSQINKGTALRKILAGDGHDGHNLIAVGNSENDLPLFEFAKTVIIVGKLQYLRHKDINFYRADTITDLATILRNLPEYSNIKP